MFDAGEGVEVVGSHFHPSRPPYAVSPKFPRRS